MVLESLTSSTVARYLDRILGSTVIGSIWCVSGVGGVAVETSLTGDILSPSAVSRDGIATLFSWIAAVGIGDSVSPIFVVLSFFFCVCLGVLSEFLVSIRGRGGSSFCSC